MLDDDTLIREWLATREPTRCPTAAVAATTATLSPEDMAAIHAHPEPVRAKGRKLPPHMHRSVAENKAAKPKRKSGAQPGSKPWNAGKHRDITGLRVNHLVALRFSHSKGSKAYWVCRCDCGRETTMRTDDLRKAKSCGCWMGVERRYEDITGKRFGVVTVLGQLPRRPRTKPDSKGRTRMADRFWRCRCDCGTEFATRTSNLNRYFAVTNRCACATTHRSQMGLS